MGGGLTKDTKSLESFCKMLDNITQFPTQCFFFKLIRTLFRFSNGNFMHVEYEYVSENGQRHYTEFEF